VRATDLAHATHSDTKGHANINIQIYIATTAITGLRNIWELLATGTKE